jgi:hypothetical protein
MQEGIAFQQPDLSINDRNALFASIKLALLNHEESKHGRLSANGRSQKREAMFDFILNAAPIAIEAIREIVNRQLAPPPAPRRYVVYVNRSTILNQNSPAIRTLIQHVSSRSRH